MTMSKCNQCGDCCKFLVMQSIDTKANREFLTARGCEILDTAAGMLDVKVNIPCQHLNSDNKCNIHDTDRIPFVCRIFPEPGQEKLLPYCGYNDD